MEFEEAVQIFGTPEFIYNSPGQADFVWYNIIAIYPQKGILFGYSETEIKRYMRDEIRPDIPLSSIMFFDPERYEEYIDAKLFGYLLPPKAFLEGLQPWNGYGKINEKLSIFDYPIRRTKDHRHTDEQSRDSSFLTVSQNDKLWQFLP